MQQQAMEARVFKRILGFLACALVLAGMGYWLCNDKVVLPARYLSFVLSTNTPITAIVISNSSERTLWVAPDYAISALSNGIWTTNVVSPRGIYGGPMFPHTSFRREIGQPQGASEFRISCDYAPLSRLGKICVNPHLSMRAGSVLDGVATFILDKDRRRAYVTQSSQIFHLAKLSGSRYLKPPALPEVAD